jgi:hypothetical protein
MGGPLLLMGGISIPNLAARLNTARLFHALQCCAGAGAPVAGAVAVDDVL